MDSGREYEVTYDSRVQDFLGYKNNQIEVKCEFQTLYDYFIRQTQKDGPNNNESGFLGNQRTYSKVTSKSRQTLLIDTQTAIGVSQDEEQQQLLQTS